MHLRALHAWSLTLILTGCWQSNSSEPVCLDGTTPPCRRVRFEVQRHVQAVPKKEPFHLTSITHPDAETPNASDYVEFQWMDIADADFQNYRCRLDSRPWESCTPPFKKNIENFSSGVHIFRVEATTQYGDRVESRRQQFVVDRIPPTTPKGLASQTHPVPTEVYSNNHPAFHWEASKDQSKIHYECRLNNDTWKKCEHKHSTNYRDVRHGTHKFYVRAADEAGNTSSPTSLSFSIAENSAKGTLSIDSASHSDPRHAYPRRRAEFTWTLQDNGVKVECQIDQKSWIPCHSKSHHSYGRLSDGSHIFRIRLLDQAKREVLQSSRMVKVDTSPPDLSEAKIEQFLKYYYIPNQGKSCGTLHAKWKPFVDEGSGVNFYDIHTYTDSRCEVKKQSFYSVKPSLNLGDTRQRIWLEVVATDLAGNQETTGCLPFASPDAPAYEGEGSKDDPFRINTPLQLYQLQYCSGHFDKHIVLTENIDLKNFVKDSPMEPRSIGTQHHPFSGVFDGRGFTIENLSLPNERQAAVGLFAYSDGVIRNLTLRNSQFKGSAAGSFVGSMLGGALENLNAESSVRVAAKIWGGGIAGEVQDGTIFQSDSAAQVSAENAGGIAGRVGTDLELSNLQTPLPSIQQSSSSGRITASSAAGGLVGELDQGEVLNSSSDAQILGTNAQALNGGMVGVVSNDYRNLVYHSLFHGKIDARGHSGGLFGSFGNGRVIGTYWRRSPRLRDSVSCYQDQCETNSVGIGLSERSLKQEQTFTQSGWDLKYAWKPTPMQPIERLRCDEDSLYCPKSLERPETITVENVEVRIYEGLRDECPGSVCTYYTKIRVNKPEKPIFLTLSAYRPTLWNIKIVGNTEILGVHLRGHHQQSIDQRSNVTNVISKCFVKPSPGSGLKPGSKNCFLPYDHHTLDEFVIE